MRIICESNIPVRTNDAARVELILDSDLWWLWLPGASSFSLTLLEAWRDLGEWEIEAVFRTPEGLGFYLLGNIHEVIEGWDEVVQAAMGCSEEDELNFEYDAMYNAKGGD